MTTVALVSRAARSVSRVAIAVLAVSAAAQVDAAEPARYPIGDPRDVTPALAGPAMLLAGGGGDVDEAFQRWIDAVRGCTACDKRLDVVVLRASGADGYNDYLAAFEGVDSVDSLVVRSRRDAEHPGLLALVRRAELVFFAGGDQCRYVRFFGGALRDAVESVHARGGGVGGSSAGLAILGEIVYDACGGSATSERALADPYDERNTFTYDFFRWPHFEALLTDTHFTERGRLGRTLTFLARQIRDGRADRAWALGVDEATAVVVDNAGRATVHGAGAAHLIRADHPPATCEPGQPLDFDGYAVWRFASGEAFDLANRPRAGERLLAVGRGVLTERPASPDAAPRR